MTERDDFVDLFAGVDAPRSLPSDLRARLADAHGDVDAVAALEAAASPRDLPHDLRDRLVATEAVALPADLRSRLLRRLAPSSPPGMAMPMPMRAAAVLVVVLLAAGGLAAVARDRRPLPPQDVVAGSTTTTSTTSVVAVDAGPTTTGPIVAVPPTTERPAPPVSRANRAALVAASSCDGLLASLRAKGGELVTAYGMPGNQQAKLAGDAFAAPAVAEQSTDGMGGGEFSGTNVQEAGVDEPDIVKTDGRRIFVLDRDGSGPQLRTLVAGPGGTSLVSTVALPQGASTLLLDGNRLLVVGLVASPEPREPQPAPAADEMSSPSMYWEPWTGLWTYAVSDAGTPQLLHSRAVEGYFVSARFTSGVARVVIHTPEKGPDYEYPKDDTEQEKQRALEANRRAVQQSTLDDWLPLMITEDRRGSDVVVNRTRLCDCDESMQPREFSGFGHLSVLTVDPGAPEAASATAVQGGANTVYASAAGLYATTSVWKESGATTETFVHRFSIDGQSAATYDGSGVVPGEVLNQFSMSEHDGHFRIATTLTNDGSTESVVTVLAKDGGRWVQVGHVGGLGKGERIYAVRFMGTIGYVVTFRQVDPLYVLDLRDPKAPRVVGELKIPGYSAYLHPTDPGRLLGVGQDATEEGRRVGSQVSLFDVGDPANPRRVDQETLGDGTSSAAEFDHHAFLWWPATRTLAIPVVDGSTSSSGVIVMRATPDVLERRGRITHQGHADEWYRTIVDRSFVIGRSLYTLSDAGLMVSDLETLHEQQWVAL